MTIHKKMFSTFTEASTFAKQCARELCESVKLKREGRQWAVIADKTAPGISGGENEEIVPSEEPESYVENRNVEQQCNEEQRVDDRELGHEVSEYQSCGREEGGVNLKERRDYYQSLPVDELEELWNHREKMNIEHDELALLREIVREKKGIQPTFGNSVKVCRQCGMVGENCTCGRSWF